MSLQEQSGTSYKRAERDKLDSRNEICGRPLLLRSRKSSPQNPRARQLGEPVQDGRIYIELINGPFLFKEGGASAEYRAGLNLAIERGWLQMHESGTFVTFTPAGAELFA